MPHQTKTFFSQSVPLLVKTHVNTQINEKLKRILEQVYVEDNQNILNTQLLILLKEEANLSIETFEMLVNELISLPNPLEVVKALNDFLLDSEVSPDSKSCMIEVLMDTAKTNQALSDTILGCFNTLLQNNELFLSLKNPILNCLYLMVKEGEDISHFINHAENIMGFLSSHFDKLSREEIGIFLNINNNIVYHYFRINDMKKSELLLKESLVIRERYIPEKLDILSKTLSNLGLVTCNLGDDDKAIELLEEAIEACQKQGEKDNKFILDIHGNIATIYARTHRNRAAYEERLKMLKIYEESALEDLVLAANIHNGLGESSAMRGQYSQAQKYYTDALTIMEDLSFENNHSQLLIVKIKSNLGRNFVNQGNYNEAIKQFEESLMVDSLNAKKVTKLQYALYEATYFHGKNLFKNGDNKQALEQFKKTVELHRTNDINWGYEQYRDLGRSYCIDNQPDFGYENFLKAIEFDENGEILYELGRCLYNKENYLDAIKMLKKSTFYAQETIQYSKSMEGILDKDAKNLVNKFPTSFQVNFLAFKLLIDCFVQLNNKKAAELHLVKMKQTLEATHDSYLLTNSNVPKASSYGLFKRAKRLVESLENNYSVELMDETDVKKQR